MTEPLARTRGLTSPLREVGEALYGEHWASPLAEALGVNRRTVQRWAVGDGAPYPDHYRRLLTIAEPQATKLTAAVETLRAAIAAHEGRR